MRSEQAGDGKEGSDGTDQNKGTGKGKAVAQAEQPDEQSPQDAMASRIGASARGLARDVFSSGSTGAASSLTHALASTQTNSAKSGASVPSSNERQLGSSHQAYVHPPSTSPGRQSFRTSSGLSNETTTELDHEAFMRSSARILDRPADSEEAWTSEYAHQHAQATPSLPEDGAEVLSLLSTPTLTTQTDSPNPYTTDAEVTSPGPLPPYIPTTVPLIGQRGDANPLNLVPPSLLLLPASSQEREQYLREWDQVLSLYADDVWGDLAPLVKEAREEVRESGVEKVMEGEEGKALGRLRMVLGHLRSRPAGDTVKEGAGGRFS